MRIDFDHFYIEPLAVNDPQSFFELLNSNKSRLEEFFAGMLRSAPTLAATAIYCEKIKERRAQKTYFPYIIRWTSTQQYIGLVDVKNIDWTIPKAEIGYFIDALFERKGIITRSVGGVVDYLVEEYQFKKLLCRANATNIGSIKVAEKNGFELEGIIRRDYKTISNKIVDLNYYGRLFDHDS